MARRRHPFNRGRWEVERERYALTRPAPPPPLSASPLAETIPQVMKQLGLEARFWEQTLVSEWHKLVGPQVAKYARPGRLDRKTLYIFVTHPAWLSELSRYGQKQILENLQRRFGADRIKGVRLQLDPDAR
jgi:predicted nucleic acid-binding Zn ribbon protein